MVEERPYHHGDLARALVDAGVDLLESGGPDAVGLRAAARQVGVSHAAPVRHFPDSASFLAAIATVAYRRLGQVVAEAAASDPDPLESFRAAGLAYIRFACDEPNLFRMLSHPGLSDRARHPELQAASLSAFETLMACVERGQQAGLMAPAEPSVLALAAWSMVHGAATLIVDDQLAAKGYHQDPETIAAHVTSMTYLGLRP